MARAFGHSTMREAARRFAGGTVTPKLTPGLNGLSLQPELVAVAKVFLVLQQARHEAEYDRTVRFTRPQVLRLSNQARRAFSDWQQVRKSLQADVFLVALLAHAQLRG